MFRFLLFPLSILYGVAVAIRNFLFDIRILKSHEFSIPVISVGNITVGGTGKTPHVEYLIELLKNQLKVSVLSRGYKRKSRGLVLASQNPVSEEIGDEPAQMKLKYPEVEIVVHSNRVQGVKFLEKRKNDLIILDDAFQHRYIKPGLSILLIDFNRRLDQSSLLPFGNLRENPKAIKRADIIIVTKTPIGLKPIERRIIYEQIKLFPFQELYFTNIIYGNLKPVFENNQTQTSDFYSYQTVYTILAVTALAYPKPFIEYLKTFTMDVCHLQFPDHSSYPQNRLNKIVNFYNSIDNDKKIIITSEKDAIKLREQTQVDELLIQNMFYIPIEIGFMDDNNKFNNQILEYVKQNKRNSTVYPKTN